MIKNLMPSTSNNISSKVLESFRGKTAQEIISAAIMGKGGDLQEEQSSAGSENLVSNNSVLKDQMGQLFNLKKQGTAQ